MAIEAETASTPGRHAILLLALTTFAVILFSGPPIPQDAAYHRMADTRPVLGIANGLNVISNVPFALVGILGLVTVFRRRDPNGGDLDARLRGPYVVLFGGTALTAVGSAYYHVAPDSARLVWDRLPMAGVSAGLVIIVLAECVSSRAARSLFLPVLALAAMSVGYWRWSELRGSGDLRAYVLVQYGSLFAIVMMLALFRGRLRGERYLYAGLAAYGLAKAFEMADAPIFALTGHMFSGHTLKHVTAAIGLACVAAMVRRTSRSSEATQPRE